MLKNKLAEVEGSLQNNRRTVNDIKEILRDLAYKRDKVNWKHLQELLDAKDIRTDFPAIISSVVQRKSENVVLSTETCSLSKMLPKKTDVQVLLLVL